MAVTDRTRKLLWARAHDACAMCRKPLTEDAPSADLPGLILGEEAHIIAKSESGPRGRDGDRSDIDGYDNLILLCADDHTRIDTFPDRYSVESLRSTKKKHEEWAAKRPLEDEPIRIVVRPGEDEIPLLAMTSGEAVWNLMVGTMQWGLRALVGDDRPEASDAADEFLTTARDWAEISDTVQADGFRAVRDAQRSLQALLEEVWSFDLFVFGLRTERVLRGGVGGPMPMPYAELAVLTAEEVRGYSAAQVPSTE